MWLDLGREGQGTLISVGSGDIIELAGHGNYVVEAGPDVLVLRDEQPADMWCEAGDPPPLVVAALRRVSRKDLSDSVGHLVFRPRHLKGC